MLNNIYSIESSLLYWLHYQQSLTEKVTELGYKVDVLVLREQWVLNLFKRDVLIHCDGVPCWYGRTIIPKKTYQLKEKKFHQLGTAPIGSILYHSNDIILKKRRFFNWQSHWYHSLTESTVLKPHQPLMWARANTFKLKQSPLYLMELFLPELINKVIIND